MWGSAVLLLPREPRVERRVSIDSAKIRHQLRAKVEDEDTEVAATAAEQARRHTRHVSFPSFFSVCLLLFFRVKQNPWCFYRLRCSCRPLPYLHSRCTANGPKRTCFLFLPYEFFFVFVGDVIMHCFPKFNAILVKRPLVS